MCVLKFSVYCFQMYSCAVQYFLNVFFEKLYGKVCVLMILVILMFQSYIYNSIYLIHFIRHCLLTIRVFISILLLPDIILLLCLAIKWRSSLNFPLWKEEACWLCLVKDKYSWVIQKSCYFRRGFQKHFPVYLKVRFGVVQLCAERLWYCTFSKGYKVCSAVD